jgi:uncharacterized protein (AIM24 family)
MNFAVEMASGDMVFIQKLMKTGSGFQEFYRGNILQTHRQQGDIISLFSSF